MGANSDVRRHRREVAGVYPRIMKDGDMDAGGWSCGMVAGLIHDIPTCKELIDRIVSEAEAIIRGRLEKNAGGLIDSLPLIPAKAGTQMDGMLRLAKRRA